MLPHFGRMIPYLCSQNDRQSCIMDDSKDKYTVISAIEEIIKTASYEEEEKFGGSSEYYRFDEKLIKEVRKPADFLAEKMAITTKQAVLFSIIVEMSKCDDFSKRDLADKLKTSFVQLLSYEDDLKALEGALIIKRGRWGKIRVGEEVLRCLEKNKAFKRPLFTDLKTFTILSRITRLFRELDNEEVEREIALNEMDAMILANPGTSIAKAANKYGILKEGAKGNEDYDEDDGWDYLQNLDYLDSMCPAERMLFYALCFRYQEYDDDYCGWWDFRDFFDNRTMEELQQYYKDEELELQRKGVITYASRDGMLVKDHFKIEDSIKEEILADCGGLHEGAPMSGLLKFDSLEEKPLFYDRQVKESLTTLNNLLTENRYVEVRKALEDKGMRSGFTCLFYGSPGTGKTESVYQLAKKTGRDIIMADVSKLKSMWVGESEKNLKRLFANYKKLVESSSITPILLFNEADAIFGIRKSGAEGAVDKMENSLQNIILQEMEDLKGILIATTNLTENLDKAFERRFLYKVKFSNPSVAVKCQIWNAMMPELPEADAHYLAEKFDFSGGQIENVVRKKTIQTILTGQEPEMETLMTFCCEEMMGAKNQQRKIGF